MESSQTKNEATFVPEWEQSKTRHETRAASLVSLVDMTVQNARVSGGGVREVGLEFAHKPTNQPTKKRTIPKPHDTKHHPISRVPSNLKLGCTKKAHSAETKTTGSAPPPPQAGRTLIGGGICKLQQPHDGHQKKRLQPRLSFMRQQRDTRVKPVAVNRQNGDRHGLAFEPEKP